MGISTFTGPTPPKPSMITLPNERPGPRSQNSSGKNPRNCHTEWIGESIPETGIDRSVGTNLRQVQTYQIFGLIGATMANLIAFILPALFFIKAVKLKPEKAKDIKNLKFYLAMSYFLVVWGIISLVVATTTQIINFGDKWGLNCK